jgi:uncharacterized membrane protein
MNDSAYFRALARGALANRWGLAVGVGFVASILGAVSTGEGVNFSDGLLDQSSENLATALSSVASIILDIAVISTIFFALISIFIGSVVSIGYAKFNLDLHDWLETPKFNTLFKYIRIWKTAVTTTLLQGLYILLWSLLFIIPGIIAAYNYAMTSYILAENPNLTASQALEMSKTIMNGNRFRLFCLTFSFIGWHLLAVLTFGIGELWVVPYEQAAIAAFYKEISANHYAPQTV